MKGISTHFIKAGGLVLVLLSLLYGIEGANERFYGVNVGGVFVLERFINPSFITLKNGIIDEWTYCKYARDNSNTTMMNALKDHWNNFITNDDLSTAARAGITHLRVAIPYWSVCTDEELQKEGEPYFTGQWPAIENLLKMAKKNGLKCILDLHAVPGSQNGFDNSGRSGDLNWGTGNTMERTLTYLERIAQRVQAMETDESLVNAVVGIELVNEAYTPKLTGGMATLKKYYQDGYKVVRKYLSAKNYYIVIEMGFDSTTWNNFMTAPDYENVILDLHIYQCFDAGLRNAPYNTHLEIACKNAPNDIVLKQSLPSFVGEWSAAYKVDSAYADAEPYPDSQQQIDFMKQYVLAQMRSYEFNPSFGWFYWTLKTEHAPMWDFLAGLSGGWIPTSYPQTGLSASCDNYPGAGNPKTLAYPQVSNVTFVPSTTVAPTTSTPATIPPQSATTAAPSSEKESDATVEISSQIDQASTPDQSAVITEKNPASNSGISLTVGFSLLFACFFL
eukprot:TRINITY_DN2761_c0_g1_i2.p1 TRINITY_DN2761_c0_g1~~TRINITY_DN2761_c0_g1_i2.p1  ORF type:complete len:504 (-),score=177.14 TRINITY_DN2761_c0_g1_i2:26-1537(-)